MGCWRRFSSTKKANQGKRLGIARSGCRPESDSVSVCCQTRTSGGSVRVDSGWRGRGSTRASVAKESSTLILSDVNVLRICKDVIGGCNVPRPAGFRSGLVVIGSELGKAKLGEFPLPYIGRGSLFGRLKGMFLQNETTEADVDPLVWRVLLQAGVSKASVRRLYLEAHNFGTFDDWIDGQDTGYWEVFSTKWIGKGVFNDAIYYRGEVVVGVVHVFPRTMRLLEICQHQVVDFSFKATPRL